MIKRGVFMIKTIGNKEKFIVTGGAKENKISSAVVAKALGVEYIGYVEANPHNLPLPKPVQERLMVANEATKLQGKEKDAEIAVLQEIG
jgi:hypothetical protein